MASHLRRIYKLALALPILGATCFVIATSWGDYASAARISDLETGTLDPIEHAESLKLKPEAEHPKEWIDTATILVERSSDHDRLAIELLERALSAYPQHPHAWALLAFLRVRANQGFDASAANALKMSNTQCGVCDRSLLKWRLAFTLHHWERADEDLRIAAFFGADFLRWWYLEYQYLRDIRAEALSNGIPFDEYRRKVGTPIRPNELH